MNAPLAFTEFHTDVARLKAAYEKRLEEREDALHDALHGSLDTPDTRVDLDCGCKWTCQKWERGRSDSYAVSRLYPVGGKWVKECRGHV